MKRLDHLDSLTFAIERLQAQLRSRAASQEARRILLEIIEKLGEIREHMLKQRARQVLH